MIADSVPQLDVQSSFLRKQAWDYFVTHASQRMSIFNFYIALSSVTVTTYFASFKSDSNIANQRWVLSCLLSLFAFIFWKLDERNKFLIKNAERALKHFEALDSGDAATKVFTQEECETKRRRQGEKGLKRILFWRLTLTYSECFNSVFILFGLVGIAGIIQALSTHLHSISSSLRHLL